MFIVLGRYPYCRLVQYCTCNVAVLHYMLLSGLPHTTCKFGGRIGPLGTVHCCYVMRGVDSGKLITVNGGGDSGKDLGLRQPTGGGRAGI